jgi:putative colanic acid biosynthesis acetyltransferase WcaF
MISARGFFSRRLHNEWLRSAPQTMSKTLDDRSQQIVRLDRFNARGFDRGRSRFVQALWLIFGGLFVSSGVPGSLLRVLTLRAFGAHISTGVVIKPHVRVKFPWRLSIGAHSWIGEGVWIDNLAQVSIGNQCCISQGAYLCTGSHNWSKETFDLITKPIVIEDGAWICAKATIGPGVRVGEGAVLALGSVATHDLDPWTCHSTLHTESTKRLRKLN